MTMREQASATIDELEAHVQQMEQELKEAQEVLSQQKRSYKELPEDDDEGYDRIIMECNNVLEGDDERTF